MRLIRRLHPLLAILLLLTALLPAKPSAAAATATVEIRPGMELLSGVLTQTSWMTKFTDRMPQTEYFRALRSFFEPYREHRAVKIAEQLTQEGFVWDRPPTFMLHLGPLPDLEVKHEYSPYLIKQAGGREKLEQFRLALKDLARESRFAEEFLPTWQSAYATWIKAPAYDEGGISGWLDRFFRMPNRQFGLVLAPGLVPSGGYGPLLRGNDGTYMAYVIVRSSGAGATPVFPNAKDLDWMAVHEWGHSYVNPAMETQAGRVATLGRYFEPVAEKMNAQSYGNLETFMNEQVLRAATALWREQNRGWLKTQIQITVEEQRGFYLTRPVMAALREYDQNREKYPDFAAYVPRLLDRLEAERAPRSAPLPRLFLVGGVLVGLFVLLLTALLARWIQRRKAAAAARTAA